jgi:hypothetical protein
MVNLINYDWTPEQIAKTSPEDQAILSKWMPAVSKATRTMFDGEESQARINLASAAGALEEAGRFARTSGMDHPEAQKRMADAEQWEGADQAFTEEASDWWHLGHGPHPSLRQAYFEDNPEVFDVFDQNPYYRTTYFTKYPDTAELYYSTRPEMRVADQREAPDEPDGSPGG